MKTIRFPFLVPSSTSQPLDIVQVDVFSSACALRKVHLRTRINCMDIVTLLSKKGSHTLERWISLLIYHIVANFVVVFLLTRTETTSSKPLREVWKLIDDKQTDKFHLSQAQVSPIFFRDRHLRAGAVSIVFPPLVRSLTHWAEHLVGLLANKLQEHARTHCVTIYLFVVRQPLQKSAWVQLRKKYWKRVGEDTDDCDYIWMVVQLMQSLTWHCCVCLISAIFMLNSSGTQFINKRDYLLHLRLD